MQSTIFRESKRSKTFPCLKGPQLIAILLPFIQTLAKLQGHGTWLVHHVVCPFTPQLSLVLINQPQRNGIKDLSCETNLQQLWRQVFAAAGPKLWNSLQADLPEAYISFQRGY